MAKSEIGPGTYYRWAGLTHHHGEHVERLVYLLMIPNAVRVVGRSLAIPLALAIAVTLLASSTANAAPGDLDPSFGVGGVVEVPWEVNDVRLDSDGRTLAVGGNRSHGWIVARFLDDGSADPSFGAEGEVRTDFPGTEGLSAEAVLLQPDGKILVGGGAGVAFALARYLPDGSLDPSFGDNGRVLTGVRDDGAIRDLALQSNGRIVALGDRYMVRTSAISIAVVRYLPDGGLDESFGQGGAVGTDFGDLAPRRTSDHESHANAVSIDPNGRIVIAGIAYWTRYLDRNDSVDGSGAALARYLPDGSLDPSFGREGRVLSNYPKTRLGGRTYVARS